MANCKQAVREPGHTRPDSSWRLSSEALILS